MLRACLLSLGLGLAVTSHATQWRINNRASTLCYTLLGPVTSADVVGTDAWATAPAPITVVQLERVGATDVARFFELAESTRAGLSDDDILAAETVPAGYRRFASRGLRHVMYTYGWVGASTAWQLPVLSIVGIGTIPDGPWGEALAISTATVATGLLDYPIRFLASYDFAYSRLRRTSRAFRAGRADRFEWRHQVRVTEPIARKLALGQRPTPEDLHDQNISEEAAGLWRAWSDRAKLPQYFANLVIEGSHVPGGQPRVNLTITLVPEAEPRPR